MTPGEKLAAIGKTTEGAGPLKPHHHHDERCIPGLVALYREAKATSDKARKLLRHFLPVDEAVRLMAVIQQGWRDIAARKLREEHRKRQAVEALYREAVEALGRAKELLDCWRYRPGTRTCGPERLCPNCLVAADAEAALAKARSAGEQKPEGKPLFESGVTLDAAGKRLAVALGHIADGSGPKPSTSPDLTPFDCDCLRDRGRQGCPVHRADAREDGKV